MWRWGGEPRLVAAIEADIAGAQAHARALDADSKGALRDIHRRVGTTILFESSGGQVDKIAHLPELRFAPRRAGERHHVGRQCRLRARGSLLLRAEGRLGWLQDQPPADHEEGGERPSRLTRRGYGDSAGDAVAHPERVREACEHPPCALPEGRRGHSRHSRHAQAYPGGDRTGHGMDGWGSAPRAGRGMDETAGPVATSVPGIPGLVSQETGSRAA